MRLALPLFLALVEEPAIFGLLRVIEEGSDSLGLLILDGLQFRPVLFVQLAELLASFVQDRTELVDLVIGQV